MNATLVDAHYSPEQLAFLNRKRSGVRAAVAGLRLCLPLLFSCPPAVLPPLVATCDA